MNSEPGLRGISIPVATPFREDGELWLDALKQNLAQYAKTDLRGFLLLGSTGEPVHVTPVERIRVIETARAAIPDSNVLLAGCGSHSTRETIEWTRVAAAAGADAALLVTPFYYRAAMRPDALERHYLEAADSSPIPVLLYSVPMFTGVALEAPLIARLAEHERIIGIKDSSGNYATFAETVRLTPAHFQVLTGAPTVLAAALGIGAAGAILAVACAVPALCTELYAAHRLGKHDRVRELQMKLLEFVSIVSPHGVGGIKAAMDAAGYVGGVPRRPLRMPDENARALIEAAVTRSIRAEGAVKPEEHS